MLQSDALKQKLRELCSSDATLLWLEGSSQERVLSVRLKERKLALTLSGGTTRVVAFERVALTSVGIQFWSDGGRPGVLYRWEQVPKSSQVPFNRAPRPAGLSAVRAEAVRGEDDPEPA